MFFSYAMTKQKQITIFFSLVFSCLFLIFIFYVLVSLVTFSLIFNFLLLLYMFPHFVLVIFLYIFFICSLTFVSNVFIANVVLLLYLFHYNTILLLKITFSFNQIKQYIQKNLMHHLKLLLYCFLTLECTYFCMTYFS